MKAQWKEGLFSDHYLDVTRAIRIHICWDGSENGFRVTFLNYTMAGRPRDLATAKAMAEKFAVIVLNKVLEALK
jgi:hypothetical protein